MSASALSVDVDSVLGSNELGRKLNEKAGLKELPEAPSVLTDRSSPNSLVSQVEQIAAGNIVPTPLSDQVSLIATGDTGVQPLLLSCREMLPASELERIRQYAVQEYPKLRRDPNVLAEFGSQAVSEMNQLVDDMLEAAGKAANIPEAKQLLKGLDDRMRQFSRKQGSIPVAANTAKYEVAKSRVANFFLTIKDWVHNFLREFRDLQAFLGTLEASLEDKRGEMRDNVADCNKLYNACAKANQGMIIFIAAMEYMLEAAVEEAESFKIDPTDPQKQQKQEQLDILTGEFIPALNQRIGDYQTRLLIGFATMPRIRGIRMVSFGVGQRMALLIQLTIPAFKMSVVEWVKAQAAAEGAELGDAVTRTTESAIQLLGDMSTQAIATAAQQNARPILTPEAMMSLVQSSVDQMRGITDAIEKGMRTQKAVSAAARSGIELLHEAAATNSAKLTELARQAIDPMDTSDDDQAEVLQLPQPIIDMVPELLAA
jgi:uncharacterized protein YaaN involved in tellurite resistance